MLDTLIVIFRNIPFLCGFRLAPWSRRKLRYPWRWDR